MKLQRHWSPGKSRLGLFVLLSHNTNENYISAHRHNTGGRDGKTGGAIVFALTFLLLFLSRKKVKKRIKVLKPHESAVTADPLESK